MMVRLRTGLLIATPVRERRLIKKPPGQCMALTGRAFRPGLKKFDPQPFGNSPVLLDRRTDGEQSPRIFHGSKCHLRVLFCSHLPNKVVVQVLKTPIPRGI